MKALKGLVYLSVGSSGVTVQGTPVRVHFISAHNMSTAETAFVRLYDATAATGGTTSADWLMSVPPAGRTKDEIVGGVSFGNGLIMDAAATPTGASGVAAGVHITLAVG